MNQNKVKGIVKIAISKGLERMKAYQESLILAQFENSICFDTKEDLEAYKQLNDIIAEIYKKYIDTPPF